MGSVTPIDSIGKMVNIGTLFAFIIVCIAVLVLRRRDPHRARPFRTPFVPLVPILGILFNGYMMVELGMANWIRLIVWLLIGLVVYFFYSRNHSKVQTGRKPCGRRLESQRLERRGPATAGLLYVRQQRRSSARAGSA